MTVKEKFDSVQEDDVWSSLPTLLIWMIKARLDYPNAVRFASVCKDWQHASESYPLGFKDESELDNSLPWIMSYEERRSESKRKFVSLSTHEHYTIESPNFYCSELVCSRRGWLLLARHKGDNTAATLFTDIDTSYESPYILFDPFKNITIELPFLGETLRFGAFTFRDENPHCVILASSYCPDIVMYVTHRHDHNWVKCTYTCMVEEMKYKFGITWVFIKGKMVYLITGRAGVFIFDIENLKWMDNVVRESSEISASNAVDELFIMQKQGEILRLYYPKGTYYGSTDLHNANIHKLETLGESAYWKPMDGHLMEQTCFWHLTWPYGCSFVTEANNSDELFGVRKARKKNNSRAKKKRMKTLLVRCRDSNLKWVHMG